MKKIFILLLVAFSVTSCKRRYVENSHTGQTRCDYDNDKDKPLYESPEGGCYYFNSDGSRHIVDVSLCDCR